MRAALLCPVLFAVGCPANPRPTIEPTQPLIVIADDNGRSLCTADRCLADLGDGVVGEDVVAGFFVENHGDGLLRLPRFVFAGDGDPGFRIDDDLPREVEPGERGVVVVAFNGDVGRHESRLLIEDEDGDLVAAVVLAANVVDCGVEGADIGVVSVDGDAIVDDEDAEFFVGDTIVVGVDVNACGGPAVSVARWLLSSSDSTTTLTETGDRAVLVLNGPADVSAILVDEAGSALASVTRHFEPLAPVDFSLSTSRGRLHVARDGLDWCSVDDCYAGHCDVGWGARGETPVSDERFFVLNRAGDGVYTAAVVVDEDSAVVLRAFNGDNLENEIVRQLSAGEPRLIARFVVENSAGTSLEIDDTSPQPGDCF